MLIENQEFRHETIDLDGNRYVRCHFIECQLIFSGFEGVNMDRCTYTRCDWTMAGPAETALLYLSALYRGLGPPGQRLVEAIFDSIRHGTVGEEVVIPALQTAAVAT